MKTVNKPTPGPWEIVADKNEHAGRILSIYPKGAHDGTMICDLIGCDNAFSNARLIAAAPELLEALQICLPAFQGRGFSPTEEESKKVLAAIARATGGTQ